MDCNIEARVCLSHPACPCVILMIAMNDTPSGILVRPRSLVRTGKGSCGRGVALSADSLSLEGDGKEASALAALAVAQCSVERE